MRIATLVLIILLAIYLYFKFIISTIKIKFEGLAGIGFSGLDFNSLNSNETIVKARIKLLATINSAFAISFSELQIQVYKNGLLIAESSKGNLENKKQITLEPKINNEIYQTFDFHFNSELIDLIAKAKAKQKYTIQYNLSLKVLGIIINQKNKTYEAN